MVSRISSNSMGLGFFQETCASQWTMELADIEVTDCSLECEGKETCGNLLEDLEVGTVGVFNMVISYLVKRLGIWE